MKIIDRMQTSSAPIRVQASDAESDLDRMRREGVVRLLTLLGTDAADQLVVLSPKRYGGTATEAGLTYESELQSIILRGRTIQSIESATFGGR
jgi:hypothetical protein